MSKHDSRLKRLEREADRLMTPRKEGVLSWENVSITVVYPEKTTGDEQPEERECKDTKRD